MNTADGLGSSGDGKSIATFTAFFRGTQNEMNDIKYRVAALKNALSVSQTETCNRIFEAGMDQLEKEHEEKIEDEMTLAFTRKNKEINKAKQIMARMEKFYGEMSLEEFMQFCEDSHVPEETVDKFMANYTWQNTDQKWATRAHDFLRGTLIDGEMKPTKEIREAAVEVGIIDDSAVEWQRLRTLASRDGFTNCPKHGYWQYKGL